MAFTIPLTLMKAGWQDFWEVCISRQRKKFNHKDQNGSLVSKLMRMEGVGGWRGQTHDNLANPTMVAITKDSTKAQTFRTATADPQGISVRRGTPKLLYSSCFGVWVTLYISVSEKKKSCPQCLWICPEFIAAHLCSGRALHVPHKFPRQPCYDFKIFINLYWQPPHRK